MKLYKVDNTGKMRVWEIRCIFAGELQITYGYTHGAKQLKLVKVELNQSGRDVREQTQLEISSRINKQLDKGYVEDIDEAIHKNMSNALNLPLPMLAQPISAVKDQCPHYYVQRKYDGMRCLVAHTQEGYIAYSRGGKVIDTIDHILDHLDFPVGTVLDGELYCHGEPLQTIMSFAKRKQAGTITLDYIIYDYITPGIYKDRLLKLMNLDLPEGVHIANTRTEPGYDLKELFHEAREDGYEGLILRNPHSPYRPGKRCSDLIKVKAVQDDEFDILDITKSVDGWAILQCHGFSVTCPGTHAFKTEVWQNRLEYAGKKVRVEYANLTKDKVPFHPVATNIVP